MDRLFLTLKSNTPYTFEDGRAGKLSREFRTVVQRVGRDRFAWLDNAGRLCYSKESDIFNREHL